MFSLLKKPSAWVPVALSMAMFGVLLFYLILASPPQPEADEGVGAHLFQIWLLLEALLIPFFAIKWLPQAPKDALLILALQIALVGIGCAPVFILQL